MNRLAHACIFIALAATLSGCTFIRVSEDPEFYPEEFEASDPHTIAIAPLTNNTGIDEAETVMRERLYGALAPLAYEDVEMSRVDRFLSGKATKYHLKLDQLELRHMVDPELADAMIFGQVDRISRLFMLLYSQIRVELRLMVIDTKTRRLLYRNHFIIRNHSIALPTSIPGILNSLFTTIWHMRPGELEISLSEAARAVAERFPVPAPHATAGSTQIDEVVVKVPRPTMRLGDRVIVSVRGSPGRDATFSIGDIVRDAPMSESSPGEYTGVYTAAQGDNNRYLYVTVTLVNRDGPRETATFQANDQPFAIDTVAPGAYKIESWYNTPARPGITLKFGPEDRASALNEELPAAFDIFRGEGPSGALKFIGRSETAEFADESALIGQQYEYGVIAEDAAGNRGPLGNRYLITPEPVAPDPHKDQ